MTESSNNQQQCLLAAGVGLQSSLLTPLPHTGLLWLHTSCWQPTRMLLEQGNGRLAANISAPPALQAVPRAGAALTFVKPAVLKAVERI